MQLKESMMNTFHNNWLQMRQQNLTVQYRKCQHTRLDLVQNQVLLPPSNFKHNHLHHKTKGSVYTLKGLSNSYVKNIRNSISLIYAWFV
jgi:hypothetical protein